LLRAECQRMKVSDQAIERARPVMDDVVRTLDALPLVDRAEELSWGLLVRSAAEAFLSDDMTETAWIHAWRSVDAAAWAVTCRPRDARRWAQLSRVSMNLGLQQVAVGASRLGRLMATDDGEWELTNRVHAHATAVLGRLDEARRLAVRHDERTLQVVIDALLGDATTVIEELLPKGRGGDLESFEWHILLLAMLATRDGRVLAFAERAIDDACHYPNEVSWVGVEVMALLALGRGREAHDRAAVLQECLRARSPGRPYGSFWYGVALVVCGRRDEGGSVLRDALGALSETVDGLVWHRLERPAVVHLGKLNGAVFTAAELAGFDEAVDARVAVLEDRDLSAELASFELIGPDAAYARGTLAMVGALLRLGSDGPDPFMRVAREASGGASDGHVSLVEERAREGARRLGAAQIAATLPSVEPPERRSMIEAMIGLDYYDADVYLRNAELADDVRRDVGRVLQDLAQAGALTAEARWVLRYLEWPEAPAPEDVTGSDWALRVPAQWLEGYDHQLSHHPIFRKAIPKVRRLTGHDEWARHAQLPPLDVSAHEGAEPDTYEIVWRGEVLEAGVAPKGRWIPSTDRQMIPSWELLEHGGAATSPWRLVRRPPEGDPFGRLCTVGTYEMLVRRVAHFASTPRAAETSAPQQSERGS
jgi:hypothetical protein